MRRHGQESSSLTGGDLSPPRRPNVPTSIRRSAPPPAGLFDAIGHCAFRGARSQALLLSPWERARHRPRNGRPLRTTSRRGGRDFCFVGKGTLRAASTMLTADPAGRRTRSPGPPRDSRDTHVEGKAISRRAELRSAPPAGDTSAGAPAVAGLANQRRRERRLIQKAPADSATRTPVHPAKRSSDDRCIVSGSSIEDEGIPDGAWSPRRREPQRTSKSANRPSPARTSPLAPYSSSSAARPTKRRRRARFKRSATVEDGGSNESRRVEHGLADTVMSETDLSGP